MEWQDIQGYKGLYKISEAGHVLSLKAKYKTADRLIKNYISKNGYPIVYLTKGGKTKTIKLHILLAKTFIPNPNNYPCVLHLDDNKINFALANLAWGTQSQNIKMAFENGRANQSGFRNNAGKIKDLLTLKKVKSDWASGIFSQKELALKYGVSQGTVSNVVTGKSYGLIESGLAIDATTLKQKS